MKIAKMFIPITIILLMLVSLAQPAIRKRKTRGPQSQECQPPQEGKKILDNVHHIFKGYNPIEGNPQFKSVDPGISPLYIFNTCFNEKKIAGDQQYLIPDGIEIHDIISCQVTSQMFQFTDESSYQQLLGVDVKVEGKLKEVSFKGSTGYKNVQERTSTNSKTHLQESSKCHVYKSDLNKVSPPQLHPDLLKVLNDPKNQDLFKKYNPARVKEYHEKLFSNFGTSCFTKMTMGAKFGQTKVVDGEAISSSNKHSGNISMNAGAKNVSVEVGGQASVEFKTKFSQTNDVGDVYTIGGNAASNLQDWIGQNKKLNESFMEIGYELKDLDQCLSDLPNLPPTITKEKINTIREALSKYCNDYYIGILKKPKDFCKAPVGKSLPPNNRIQPKPEKHYILKNRANGFCLKSDTHFHGPVNMVTCDQKDPYQAMAISQTTGGFDVYFIKKKKYYFTWYWMYIFGGGKDGIFIDRSVKDGGSGGDGASMVWELIPDSNWYTFKAKNQCLVPLSLQAMSTTTATQVPCDDVKNSEAGLKIHWEFKEYKGKEDSWEAEK